MKSKIEGFLGGHIYPVLMILISFAIWSFKYYIPDDEILSLSINCSFFLTVPFFLILVFYKNTVYTLPILLSMLFTLGVPNIGIETFDQAFLGFFNIGFVLFGTIIHLIKYRVRFKLKSVGLSLILVSISFIIPLLYTEIVPVAVLLSLLGPLYLFVYLFYANTITGNQVHYLMRSFASIGLFLSFQLVSMWYISYLSYEGTDVLRDFLFIFPKGSLSIPGWGNINDLTIHLVLISGTVIYYLHKYPKSIMPWLYLGWIAFWIYISGSRGSIVTITISAIGSVIYAIFKRNKRQLINLGISTLIAVALMYILSPLIKEVWDTFFATIDFDDPNYMLTGRVELWWDHEYSAWNEFLRYPWFGRGWYTELFLLSSSENRVTIYHSTIFQVLATGGIFGILILIYHWYQIGLLLRKNIKIKAVSAFIFTLILTGIHGLFDNTQYMLHYSIVTYAAFAVIDNVASSHTNDILEVAYKTLVEA